MNPTNTDRHNPDRIERAKPCDICGKPIGDEAMYTEPGKRYHARCIREREKKPDV